MSTNSTESSPDTGEEASELPDEEVRQRIGPWKEDGAAPLDYFDGETNFLVRAAAGSGKTTALVARMVALVRRGHPVENLAAITFTRKAAGEMTARFYKELQAIAPKLDGQEQTNVETALQNLHGTYIGTIHGFCGRLLREHAMAAELPPDFSVGLEGRDEMEMRDRAWQDFLDRAYAEDPERIEHLQELGVELKELGPFFETLCKYPELEVHTDAPADLPDLSGAVREAKDVLREWQPRRPDMPTKDRDDVQKAFDRAEAMLEHHPMDQLAQQAKFLGFFEGAYSDSKEPGEWGTGKVTLNRWNKQADVGPKVLKEEDLPRLVEEEIRPVLRPWQAYVHKELGEAVQPAIEAYREMRTEEGSLTHNDILLFTRDLLRENESVRAQAQQRVSHLLVDEFQDTDPLQAQILFYLTSQDTTQDDWRKCIPRPGSLFIVGDDKQSIYRFRRADKAVFDEVTQRLEELERPHGEVVDLITNFRSYGALLDGWNEAFGDIFADPKLEDLQAEYEKFASDRDDGRDRTGLRQLTVGDADGNWAKNIAPKEAPKIARFIDEAVDAGMDHELAGPEGGNPVFPGGAAYEDFLVLTRYKGRLPIYAKVLARRGIPYTITGAEDLDESPELRALAVLLECALKPTDPVSTVGYLRGLLAGLSDGKLYQVRQAYNDSSEEPFTRFADPSLREQLCGRLEEPLAEHVSEASKLLQDVREHLQRRRPGTAIEKIIGESGLLAASAHPPNAGTATLRAGRMLRVLNYVRQRAEEGQDWAEILEALQDIVDGEEEVESITLDTGRDNAVRVMNVHQAKGLEAPVVFLADPYSRNSGHDLTHHVRRDPAEDVEDLVAPVVEGEGYYETVTYAPLGWHEGTDPGFLEEEERHQEAEEKRLLYVAATRAENLLVVSRYETKSESGPWSDLYSYLDEEEVPELTIPDWEEEGKETTSSEPAISLQEQLDARDTRLEPLRSPSYASTAATEHKKRRMSKELSAGEAYGGEFGMAVHELLEKAVRVGVSPAELSETHVKKVLEEAETEVTPEKTRQVRQMLEAFEESGLPETIESAKEVLVEYPITSTGQSSEDVDVPEIVSGKIDLLYQDEKGWHLVDYKTDWLDGPEALGDLSPDHPYPHQLRTYADLWEQQTGKGLASARLWFADANRFAEVSLRS